MLDSFESEDDEVHVRYCIFFALHQWKMAEKYVKKLIGVPLNKNFRLLSYEYLKWTT